MDVTACRLQALSIPLTRSIGDSQIDPISEFRVVLLELETDTGTVGVGFDTVETDLETIAAALEARRLLAVDRYDDQLIPGWSGTGRTYVV